MRRDKLHKSVCVFVSVRGHGTRVMCVVMSFTRRLEREQRFRAVKSGLERRGGAGGGENFISLKLCFEVILAGIGESSVE